MMPVIESERGSPIEQREDSPSVVVDTVIFFFLAFSCVHIFASAASIRFSPCVDL